MTDEFDALRAALKAVPPAEADARAAALQLAMQNYERNFEGNQNRHQGSADPLRLSLDRPARAGLLMKVRSMLKSLSLRPMLTATTSVAALCLGVVFVVPMLHSPLPVPAPLPVTLPAKLPAQSSAQVPAKSPVAPPAPKVKGEVAATSAPLADKSMADAAPGMALDNGLAQRRSDALAQRESDSKDVATAIGGAAGQTSAAPVEAAPPAAPPVAPPVAPKAAPLAEAMQGAPAQPLAKAARGLIGSVSENQLALAEPSINAQPLPTDTEAYSNAAQNPVHITAEEPVSTFSSDVDTASYAVIRSSLNAGQLPPVDAVRIEEMINYFPYAYPAPEGDAPFQPTISVMPTPWNPNTRLVSIAVQGRAISERPPLNLVFLIDTSGSMEDANKLPLLRQSLALMLPRLDPQDRVAIVTYAGSAGEVLPPTKASERGKIMAALDNLSAGGSTAGAEGLRLAYQVAGEMAEKGRISRVLLATDGDFNVGIDNPDDLKTFIAQERTSGTYLSVLGFGRGNLDDATMQALAQNGNGTASYIDTLSEAQKVLGDQLTGALFPIANDVKIQVEWNPAQVAEYRLIGYETRALKREDFNNDKVDAGEIGAGSQVTALYEITAPDSPAVLNDPLRYGAAPAQTSGSGELGFLRLRYKTPGEDVSHLIQTPIEPGQTANPETNFAAAIAGFGQLLEHSPYLGSWGYDQAIALATSAKGADAYGYRAEAITLMRLAQSLSR